VWEGVIAKYVSPWPAFCFHEPADDACHGETQHAPACTCIHDLPCDMLPRLKRRSSGYIEC
jgi:hypothetical protein